MPRTLQAEKSPQNRISVGQAILSAASEVNTAPIKDDLAAFVRIDQRYVAAETAVRKAERNKRAQEQKAGERDVDQDHAIVALGTQLSADGLPKGNPFSALKGKKPFPPPSTIRSIGYDVEAATIHELVVAVKKHHGLSKRSLALAARADKAASAVERELAPIPKLGETFSQTIRAREALAQPWETALSTLKAATRYADQKHGTRLFAALFQSAPRTKKARKKKSDPAPKTPE